MFKKKQTDFFVVMNVTPHMLANCAKSVCDTLQLVILNCSKSDQWQTSIMVKINLEIELLKSS